MTTNEALREAAEYALDYLVASNQRFNVDPIAIEKLEKALAASPQPAPTSLYPDEFKCSSCGAWTDLRNWKREQPAPGDEDLLHYNGPHGKPLKMNKPKGA